MTDEVVYTLAVATGDPPNTEAVPDFLYNSATGAILDPAGLELVDIGSADVTEVDGAGPVLVSAEGRVESRELFVRFSEPVLGTGTGTGSDLIAADFFYQNNFNASVKCYRHRFCGRRRSSYQWSR